MRGGRKEGRWKGRKKEEECKVWIGKEDEEEEGS